MPDPDPLGRFRRCTGCDYDLRGRPRAERCPECGAEYAGELTIRQQTDRGYGTALIILGLVLIAATIASYATDAHLHVLFVVFGLGCVIVGARYVLVRLRIRKAPRVVIGRDEVRHDLREVWCTILLRGALTFDLRRDPSQHRTEDDDRPARYRLILNDRRNRADPRSGGFGIVFIATELEVSALRAELGRRFSEAHQTVDA